VNDISPLAGIVRRPNETLKVFPNGFIRYNHISGKRITVKIEAGTLHVREEQNVEKLIELNKTQQNDFTGYRGKLLTQLTRIPEVIHNDFMRKCGFVPGQGYDEKRFKQLINDPDHRYLKTVPGKI
jgi:hypothetical protein